MKNVPILAIGFAVAAVFAASPPDNYLTLAEWKKALSENDGYLRVLQVQNRNVLESAKALVNKIGTNGTIDLVRANRHADEIVMPV